MVTRDTIVIGASAGGFKALLEIVSQLPADLPAAVFIVLHIPSDVPSMLPEILGRESNLTVAHAKNGEEITSGHIYVAPPDHHLLIEKRYVKLVHGPKENLHRPSIDALFRSAARWAGPRVIGVVLSGARYDGTAGMRQIKQCGGMTIVQDPLEAQFPSMPQSVMHDIRVDYSLALREIAPMLDTLSRQPAVEGVYPVPAEVKIEARITEQEMGAEELLASVQKIGKVSTLTCPDCNGTLWEINDQQLHRYRCHAGHAHTADSLTDGQSQMIEAALWSAVRALEERMMLARRIAERARQTKNSRAERTFERRAQEAAARSSMIRQLLLPEEKGDIAEPAVENENELSVS